VWSLGCRYLVYVGCIKPLCDLLDVNEVKIIKVAMEGLENILKVKHRSLHLCMR